MEATCDRNPPTHPGASSSGCGDSWLEDSLLDPAAVAAIAPPTTAAAPPTAAVAPPTAAAVATTAPPTAAAATPPTAEAVVAADPPTAEAVAAADPPTAEAVADIAANGESLLGDCGDSKMERLSATEEGWRTIPPPPRTPPPAGDIGAASPKMARRSSTREGLRSSEGLRGELAGSAVREPRSSVFARSTSSFASRRAALLSATVKPSDVSSSSRGVSELPAFSSRGGGRGAEAAFVSVVSPRPASAAACAAAKASIETGFCFCSILGARAIRVFAWTARALTFSLDSLPRVIACTACAAFRSVDSLRISASNSCNSCIASKSIFREAVTSSPESLARLASFAV